MQMFVFKVDKSWQKLVKIQVSDVFKQFQGF